MENDRVEKKIEEVVLELLNEADFEIITPRDIRTKASERLGLDLSVPHHKKLVREIIEAYVSSQQTQESEKKKKHKEKEEDNQEEGNDKRGPEETYDLNNDPIVCHLSDWRKVVLQRYNKKTFVSIRQYFQSGRKKFPTKTGISLPVEQWKILRDAAPAIDDAIKQLQRRSSLHDSDDLK
ncbi:hypothetical protein LUZ60_011623 [Juncus effusus]|nr:hypothetical protein LUZ60_011623 [Juncus effusus]